MDNILTRVSVSQLKRAVAIKEKIEQLEKELAGLLGTSEPSNNGRVGRKRRKMSAAARAKISAAAKARWAKVRAAKKK